MLCEGLGLRPDFFIRVISGSVTNDINYFPPCPNPSRTLGLPPHCDRDLITVLLPGIVPGLEIAYKGDWIKVQPVPNSLQLNFGLQLEVMTPLFLQIGRSAMLNCSWFNINLHRIDESIRMRAHAIIYIQVLTNGFLKAVPHRVITNSTKPRVSVATFLSPALDCVVGPAEEFVSEDNPPRYRSLTFGEFKRMHHVVHLGSSINQVMNIQNGI